MYQKENYSLKRHQFTLADCKRNVRIFQITGIDITVLIVPVIVLVWLEAQLTFSEILLLQGIFVIPTLFLEVPSGSIADYWSRKGCIAVYNLLFGAALFIYAIGDNFWLFALAEFLAGIGIAFNTGSDSALLYDSLLTQETNPNGKFGRIVSQRMTVMFIGGAFGAILGGIIGTLSMIRIPIIIAFIGHIGFAFLVNWGYIEPPRLKAKSPQAAMKQALSSLRKGELVAILIFSLTYLVFGRIGFWAVQHIYVENYMIDALGMAFVIAGFNVCAAISSIMIRSRIERYSNFTTFLIILLIESVYFWMLIQAPGLIGIFIVSLFAQVTRGIRTPLVQELLQSYLSSDMRATFASLISLAGSLLYLLLTVTIDGYNLSRAITLNISLIGMIIVILLFVGIITKKYFNYPQISALKTQ